MRAGPLTQPTAPIYEVFTSAQGEGLLVGVRQLFIRFRGCDLDCVYCDTPQARTTDGPCMVEERPGSGQFVQRNNPLSVDDLLVIVERLVSADNHAQHSIALTGGEPLLYPGYLTWLAAGLRDVGQRIYLETAGHLPHALEQVIAEIDWVAMDWKLPSSLAHPVAPSRFGEFLNIAQRQACFIKMVVSERTSEDELLDAWGIMSNVTRSVPLILQPVTPIAQACNPPVATVLLKWQAMATTFLDDVRIIPQCHRLVGVR